MSSPTSPLPDALLLDLYASAAEPARWPKALDQICLQTGACSAVAVAFSYDDGRTRTHWRAKNSRLGPLKFPANSNMHTDSNPRLDCRRALRGLNRIIGDDVLFDPGDPALARMQRELATVGSGRSIVALQEVSPGMFLGLHLSRPIDDRLDFSTAQVGSVAALTPHLGQTFMLTDHLQTSLMRDRHLRGQLERLRCGIVFCDVEGRVHWLNRSAERLLAAGPLRLVGSRLLGDTQADNAKLMKELAEAGSTGGHPARYLRIGHGKQVLHVAIEASAHPSTMVLTLTSPSRGADVPTDALIQLFGLTLTEAGLVAALATGKSLEEYAQRRAVSIGTTRMHLKHIYVKTGAQRQSDLVRLVWSSAVAYSLLGYDGPAEPSKPPDASTGVSPRSTREGEVQLHRRLEAIQRRK